MCQIIYNIILSIMLSKLFTCTFILPTLFSTLYREDIRRVTLSIEDVRVEMEEQSSLNSELTIGMVLKIVKFEN